MSYVNQVFSKIGIIGSFCVVGDGMGGGGGNHTAQKPIYRVLKSVPPLFTFDSAHIFNSSAYYNNLDFVHPSVNSK
jgi:hypothetical protein